MASQIVMDHTGDTRHQFDAADAEALHKAEERFRSLTKVGFTAAVRTASGDVDGDKDVRSNRRRDVVLPASGWRLNLLLR